MKKPLVYLAGGIEKRADHGMTWRRLITPKLEKLGYEVFNPCFNDNDIFKKYDTTLENLKEQNKSFIVELSKKIGRDIVNYDLEIIRRCDVLIAYYDESVNQSSGTVSEMTAIQLLNQINEKKKIPVYAIRNIPYRDIPTWTMGCVDKFFNTIDECIDYMKEY